ncbi:MmgE/PrpD family protein [Stappia taiwanensis]|uniref:MmgE/PrpD family protein n=2 Tax=Stappia taiwanensis TaxID=992267 RepID=A0A838XRV3_9HYPH|nr:MmgE/PrpD family protein [Stappia taiwanensis]GGF05736.1 hypothetical protein GCM10007285_37020 [Stappia taiwanensis]
MGISARLAAFIAETPRGSIPTEARVSARLSLLDWVAVGLAGKGEPIATIVRTMVEEEGGAAQATVVGSRRRLPARAAALANGATAHALDYDDTHFDYIGHPSVAILPAALALAEKTGADGAALLDAFIIGLETACRVGTWLGDAHYRAGFHQTATAGAFGAAAASARLLGLDAQRTAHALGLMSTRASGLKSQFGTMGKPYHAGIAAANGVETATLAVLGLISNPEGLACAQGFAATHAGAGAGAGVAASGDPKAVAAFDDLGRDYRFTRVQYKFHACCHGTHAAIEALLELLSAEPVRPEQIARVVIEVHPRWLAVCNIAEPRTGLEAKFSYRLIAALVLSGRSTAALTTYTDAICTRADLVRLRDRVEVTTNDGFGSLETRVALELEDGRSLSRHVDLDRPVPFEVSRGKLTVKAEALLGKAAAGRLLAAVDELEQGAPDRLAALLQG